jgi:arginine utilization regulatory protein
MNALEKENRLLHDILDHINEGVYCVDEEMRVIIYNHTSEINEGFKKADVMGKREMEIYHTNRFTDDCVKRVIKNKAPLLEIPFIYQLPSGREAKTILNIYPFFDQGEIRAVYSIGREMNYINSFIRSTLEIQKKMKKAELSANGKASSTFFFDDIVGESREIKEAVKTARQIAEKNSTLMLVGETGTGKELFAQGIHNASLFSNGEFIPVNCAAIPESLIESVLFGTVKGAFTGAIDLPGLFEQAAEGTIFLDEINSLPPHLQGRLLRFLQNRVVRRIGGKEDIPINCRILSAINKDPLESVHEHTIREDLFYRLSTVSLCIPPLREREGDVLVLCKHFIVKYNKAFNLCIERISKEVLSIFEQYSWPGNVRELESTIECMMNLVTPKDKQLETTQIPTLFWEKMKENFSPSCRLSNDDVSLKEKLRCYENQLIMQALKVSDGNITKAASLLKTSRQNLHLKIKQMGTKY